MKSRNLLVSKESVRHPDFTSIGKSEVTDLVWGNTSLSFLVFKCSQDSPSIPVWSLSWKISLLSFHLCLRVMEKSYSFNSCPEWTIIWLMPTHHGDITDGTEVPYKYVDVHQGGRHWLILPRRSQPGVVHLRPEDIVQDFLLHLSVVDDVPGLAPVPWVVARNQVKHLDWVPHFNFLFEWMEFFHSRVFDTPLTPPTLRSMMFGFVWKSIYIWYPWKCKLISWLKRGPSLSFSPLLCMYIILKYLPKSLVEENKE